MLFSDRSCIKTVSIVSEGEKIAITPRTPLSGSLYMCEIRAHWPSLLFGKQLKQIVISNLWTTAPKNFELQGCFKGRSGYFLHWNTCKRILAPVWIYICSHSLPESAQPQSKQLFWIFIKQYLDISSLTGKKIPKPRTPNAAWFPS